MQEQWNMYEQSPSGKQQEKGPRLVKLRSMVAGMLVCALLGAGLGGALVHYGNIQENQPPSQAYQQEDPGRASAGSAPQVSGSTVQSGAAYSKQEAAALALPSVVGIETRIQRGRSEGAGFGSGVITTADGYILTNYHVIAGATAVTVYLYDGSSHEARIVGQDERSDLAVLQIEADGLQPVQMGDSQSLRIGEEVLAIGNPLGELMSSVTFGSISGLNRQVVVENVEMTLLQTDAAINPGNSGGGLFNMQGQLVGVVNAKSMGFDVEGIGFAIPVNDANAVYQDLLNKGYVTGRPYLGVSLQEIYTRQEGSGGFFLEQQYLARVQIVEVTQGSAADLAGLKAGDIILSLGENQVESLSQFISLIGAYQAGDVVTIQVQRGTQEISASITLGEKTGA